MAVATTFDKDRVLRYITNTAPLSEQQLEGARAALDWIERNAYCVVRVNYNPSYRQRVIKAIYDTIREDYHIRIEELFSTSRRRQLVLLRARAMTTFIEFTGASQNETARAFSGMRKRVAIPHYMNIIKDTCNLYPDERHNTEKFREAVISRLTEKTTIKKKACDA